MTEQVKRTRRTPEQMQADGAKSRAKEPAKGRSEIRQKIEKPLKLDVQGIKAALEKEKGAPVMLKFVDFDQLDNELRNGWETVKNSSATPAHSYGPDGRKRIDNEHQDDGGAYTVRVGADQYQKPRYNFLISKDLESYQQEDAVWNKVQADAPMEQILNPDDMGARAGLGGEFYEPKQGVTIK